MMAKWFLAWLTAYWFLDPSGATAAEIRFADGECNNCLYLIGEIVDGDYGRFREALKGYVKKNGPEYINLELRSGGGNVVEAINIGRLVRGLYIRTDVPIDQKWWNLPETRNVPGMMGRCDREQRFFKKEVPCLCGSACVLIFWGGMFRYGDELYIHRIKYRNEYFRSLSPEEAQRKYQEGMSEIRGYLREMGIDEKWYHRMLRTESSRYDKLTPQEANEFFGYIPAIAEWLTAKCGSEQEAYKRGSNCWYTSLDEPRREAYRRLLN